MKKQDITTSVGYTFAFAALCSMTMSPGMAAAAERSVEDAASSDGAIVSTQANNAPTAASKDETVYVFAQADGTVKNSEVSVKLSNPDGTSELADSSILTDIENVEGMEGYNGQGSNMVWDADGNDIYYRGNTTADMPVTVKVTYNLDGKEVTPQELVGKSGHVTIRYDYTNNSKTSVDVNGTAYDVFTPFVVMTGMMFDNDLFENVEVVNGKAVDDGDRTLVVGYAMPGLQDSLSISSDYVDATIPEYFEVEADVTDFKLDPTLTMVSAGMVDDLDTSDIDTSELSDDSAQLKDAMSQLMDGSNELNDGLDQLYAGIELLAAKASDMPSGIDALYSGSGALIAGLQQLEGNPADTSGSLYAAQNGANTLATGARQLADGTDDVIAGIGSPTDSSTSTLNGTLNIAKAKLGNPGDVRGALLALQSAQATLESLSANAQDAADSLTSLSTTLSGVETQFGDLSNGVSTAKENADNAQSAADDAAASTSAALSALNNMDTEGMTDAQIAALGTAQDNLAAAQSSDAAASQYAGGAGTAAQAVQDGMAGVSGSLASIETSLNTDAQAFSDAATALKANADTLAAIDPNAIGSATDFVTVQALIQGVQDNLNAIKGSPTDTSGSLYAARNGANQLVAGANSLSSGLGGAITGVETLTVGAGNLQGGLAQLDQAAPQLVDGINQLSDGSKSAVDGSQQLSDGLQQFNDEGISKITDLLDSDVLDIGDRLTAVREAANRYDNFSGITDGTTGTVKFVYEIDAIE